MDEKFGLINDGAITTGAIIMWSGITAPSGWMICNGDPHPKTGKPVPDLRGRFVVGYDSTEGSGYTSIGAGTKLTKDYNITSDNMPKHSHPFKNYYYIEDGKEPVGADGTVKAVYGTDLGSGSSDYKNSVILYKNCDTDEAGKAEMLDIRPPYFVLAYIIKI